MNEIWRLHIWRELQKMKSTSIKKYSSRCSELTVDYDKKFQETYEKYEIISTKLARSREYVPKNWLPRVQYSTFSDYFYWSIWSNVTLTLRELVTGIIRLVLEGRYLKCVHAENQVCNVNLIISQKSGMLCNSKSYQSLTCFNK